MCDYGTDCDDCGLRDNSPPPMPPPPMQTIELSTYPGSLSDALRALAQPRADGSAQPRVPVTIALPRGEYIMENGIAINAHMAASELWIVGESSSASMSESNGPSIIGTVIRAMPGNEDNLPLLQISAGGPFVHLVNLHIVGVARPILVSGGEVIMENCALENSTEGFTVKVNNGSFALRDSVLRGNQAMRGGALQVLGGSVDVRRSRLEENHASDSGGAVYLHGGTLYLAERTLLVGNRAPFGRSVYIDAGSVAYALPAPLGRWIYAPGSQRAVIGVGAIDDDYPFACSPGLYGDSYDVAQQSGPSCTAACPAGYFCGGATVEPSLCMNGTYCIKGSPTLYRLQSRAVRGLSFLLDQAVLVVAVPSRVVRRLNTARVVAKRCALTRTAHHFERKRLNWRRRGWRRHQRRWWARRGILRRSGRCGGRRRRSRRPGW